MPSRPRRSRVVGRSPLQRWLALFHSIRSDAVPGRQGFCEARQELLPRQAWKHERSAQSYEREVPPQTHSLVEEMLA